MNHGDITL